MTLNIHSISTGRLIKPRRPSSRRFLGRRVADREPVIISGEVEGAPVLHVETFGRHGGAAFTLDPDRWAAISSERGTQWGLIPGGGRLFYVVSGRIAATKQREHDGITPLAFLARIVVGATADQRVRFKNGKTLDLRVSNLELLDGPRRASGTRRSLVVQGH